MPFIPDIAVGTVHSGEPEKQIESIVKQTNEAFRLLSNEKRTDVYKDNSGTPRILIGVLPDGTTGIVISKDGINVNTVFS